MTHGIVQLKYPAGIDRAYMGLCGIHVSHDEFPELYRLLVEHVGQEAADKEFIGIEWVCDNLGPWMFGKDYKPPRNGFYHKHRFQQFKAKEIA